MAQATLASIPQTLSTQQAATEIVALINSRPTSPHPDEIEAIIAKVQSTASCDQAVLAEGALEGLDEILTVNRLRLPPELRRSLACTNAIENMQSTIRRVTRNVKRWRDASMALRWAAAGMMEAKAGFRRLKAYRPGRLDTPG